MLIKGHCIGRAARSGKRGCATKVSEGVRRQAGGWELHGVSAPKRACDVVRILTETKFGFSDW